MKITSALSSPALLALITLILTAFATNTYAEKNQKDKLVPLIFNDSELFDSSIYAQVKSNGSVDILYCVAEQPCTRVTQDPIQLDELMSAIPNENLKGTPVKKAGFKDYFTAVGLGHLAGTALTFVAYSASVIKDGGTIRMALADGRFISSFYLAAPAAFLLAPSYGTAAMAMVGSVAAVSVAVSVGAIYWGVQKYKERTPRYESVKLDMSINDFFELVNSYENALDSIAQH